MWGSAAILTLSTLGCDDEGTPPSVNRAPEATGAIPAQALVHRNTPVFMSACDPAWVSDFHFSNAARYRLADVTSTMTTAAHQERVLFLWGGVDAAGAPRLDPAFVLDAPPSLPRSEGPHQIIGARRGRRGAVRAAIPDARDRRR